MKNDLRGSPCVLHSRSCTLVTSVWRTNSCNHRIQSFCSFRRLGVAAPFLFFNRLSWEKSATQKTPQSNFQETKRCLTTLMSTHDTSLRTFKTLCAKNITFRHVYFRRKDWTQHVILKSTQRYSMDLRWSFRNLNFAASTDLHIKNTHFQPDFHVNEDLAEGQNL